jgi:tetratricopeptide (TPR) repeat protein
MKKLAFALLIATSLYAQAPPSFREGVLAFEKKEWKNAERLMREAIAGNPKETEGTVSIAGSWFETYVPHYFLARALARQGKCAEALKEFEESERQGVTPTIPDFARHLQTRGGCKPQAKAAKPKEIVLETTVPFAEDVAPAPAPVALDPNAATRLRLRAAMNSYLHGRYAEALRVLTQSRFDDRAAAAEAALFRAASRHALYRSGGEKDGAAMKQIAEDIALYRALRPEGKPDPRVFPPGFIALLERRRPGG